LTELFFASLWRTLTVYCISVGWCLRFPPALSKFARDILL